MGVFRFSFKLGLPLGSRTQYVIPYTISTATNQVGSLGLIQLGRFGAENQSQAGFVLYTTSSSLAGIRPGRSEPESEPDRNQKSPSELVFPAKLVNPLVGNRHSYPFFQLQIQGIWANHG